MSQTQAGLEAELRIVIDKHRDKNKMSVADVDGVLGTVKFQYMQAGLQAFENKAVADEEGKSVTGHSPVPKKES